MSRLILNFPDKPTLVKYNDQEQFKHVWSLKEWQAVNAAYAAGRPLLVRGEPGVGKTQLAMAVAAVAGRPLIAESIVPGYESGHLLFQFDAVARLADSQLGSRRLPGGKMVSHLKQDRHYLKKGPIWRTWSRGEEAPAVLLIDEIDKASADLPNSLLSVFGQGFFSAPGHAEPVTSQEGKQPFVLITTNEDRELPAAFVRRCVVLNLNPPSDRDDPEAFKWWLIDRAEAQLDEGGALAQLQRFPKKGAYSTRSKPLTRGAQGEKEAEGESKDLLMLAAEQTLRDRQKARELHYMVGLAEYLDLLVALATLAPDDYDQQVKSLEEVGKYFLEKHRDQQKEAPKSADSEAKA
jgi:AAA domain (dynein-related subfamily)